MLMTLNDTASPALADRQVVVLALAFVRDVANISRDGGDLLEPLVFAAIVQANQAALRSDPAAGLYEVLTGTVPLNDALVRDPRSGAFLLVLKQRPAQAAAMFTSPQMHRLLDILRDSCDLVILDCGLALNGPEAALIARQADATLVVSRRDRLRGRSLTHATRMLENAKAAPVGLVLAS